MDKALEGGFGDGRKVVLKVHRAIGYHQNPVYPERKAAVGAWIVRVKDATQPVCNHD